MNFLAYSAVTTAVYSENLPSLVEEIAHKERVQEPAFIIKCWKPTLRSIGQSMSTDGLKKILDDLKPKDEQLQMCLYLKHHHILK
ncbi:hypothetical protein FQN60_018381 [Etheostoma spectabile]|uniref:Uncharacterized protein n=1 Tax=Etheostoma spectabile TaxID=54343 RepID=A0A5J5DHT1_9PERO|nr:hypothetical protein FQN60_018381 [Etheostoma spectabile]